ncbi:hypothetical protein MMC20_000894 [Loxospora ochrophaea]|nr:hypothetical protein [Loxospora ochrophaea]
MPKASQSTDKANAKGGPNSIPSNPQQALESSRYSDLHQASYRLERADYQGSAEPSPSHRGKDPMQRFMSETMREQPWNGIGYFEASRSHADAGTSAL